jgi:hypothetical protein
MPGDRDWRKYNEALVRRGELDIDPSVLEDWGRELRRANRGKVGEPYSHHCPKSFIGLLAFFYSGSSSTPHALEVDRGVRALPPGFAVEDGLRAPDYSAMKGRMNGLRVDLGGSLSLRGRSA